MNLGTEWIWIILFCASQNLPTNLPIILSKVWARIRMAKCDPNQNGSDPPRWRYWWATRFAKLYSIQYRYSIPPPEAYKMINKVALYCSVADAAKFPPATAKIFNITFVHLQDAFLWSFRPFLLSITGPSVFVHLRSPSFSLVHFRLSVLLSCPSRAFCFSPVLHRPSVLFSRPPYCRILPISGIPSFYPAHFPSLTFRPFFLSISNLPSFFPAHLKPSILF